MNISYEQLEKLIQLATSKDYLDVLAQLANIATTLGIVIITWIIFIYTPKQNRLVKIQEKEIEMLYRAFDSFHNFVDAFGLYISNKHRKYKKIKENKGELEESFSDKEKKSSDAVYLSFRDYTLASHILRSIGDKRTEYLVDIYKKTAVEARAFIYRFEFEEDLNSLDDIKLTKFIDEINLYREVLDKLKDKCFDSISNYKELMK